MQKNLKVSFILETLNDYFPDPIIPLDHENAYELLIAVLLSAQCTDERVNKVTPKLFAVAKTPFEMIHLKEEIIASIIKPLGLANRKAKAILSLSKKLVDEFSGKVPSTLEELESLEGVGHKTASVVLIQAFQIPAFPIDTHIHRLAKRWGLSNGKSVEQTETDLKKLFPQNRWVKLHLQMIYYARQFCPARGHILENCPICKKIISK